MELITWKDKYNTGVDFIDNQHKTIIDIINRLYNLLNENDKDNRGISTILNDIEYYIITHFAAEEKYMADINYPYITEQKEQHNYFVDEICDFKKNLLKNRYIIKINLYNFVWDWFSQHILNIDKKISSFAK